MKKTILLLSGIATVFFSSCKKEYHCNCTSGTYTYIPPGMDEDIQASSKVSAESRCKNNLVEAWSYYSGYPAFFINQMISYYGITCNAVPK